MIRTFIDAGVLIYAARGQNEIAELALQVLEQEIAIGVPQRDEGQVIDGEQVFNF
ncbi:MAG: hypothetical protein HLUCCO16_02665 [Phormidium sp. OSCR]|nr:MAG: hypothetical protein HLUCCO16_02665 [Phormidium sp. OSCR]